MSNIIKKDSKWSFIELSKFKIDEIKKEILSYKEEWLQDQSRQNTYITHKDTETISLLVSDYNWIPGEPLDVDIKHKFNLQKAQDEIENIYQKISSNYEGNIVRSEIVKLKSGAKIRKHVDGGAMLQYARRIHIPIITNPQVYFTVNNKKINMEESQGYEINNAMPHSVENNSPIDRVHIIIDIMPNIMLNYVKTGE
jgi:translation elongation factor P/translation initiation factor 5A